MAHLVRARVKRVEDLPEWAKCCEKATAIVRSVDGQTLDIDKSYTAFPAVVECRFCKSTYVLSAAHTRSVQIVSGKHKGRYISRALITLPKNRKALGILAAAVTAFLYFGGSL